MMRLAALKIDGVAKSPISGVVVTFRALDIPGVCHRTRNNTSPGISKFLLSHRHTFCETVKINTLFFYTKGATAMGRSCLKKNSLAVILCCCMVLVFGSLNLVFADATATLKEVSKTLRSAERDMFGGKAEKSIAALENIQVLLGQLKQDDPNNPKLKSVEKKYQKLVKDLERRTGKNLGGGSLSAVATSTIKDLPAKPEAKSTDSKDAATPGKKVKLPHQARRPIDNAKRGIKSIDTLFVQLGDPEYRGDRAQLVSRIENSLNGIQKQLDEARTLAAAKNVSSHPSFDEVEAGLVVVRDRAETAKTKFSEQQAQSKEQAQEIEADVQKLKEEYDRLNAILGAATGSVIYYNDLEPARNLLVQLNNFEANDRASLAQLTNTFADKYGQTGDAIDNKASQMGYVGEYYSASFHYLELSSGLEKISRTRLVMAEDLARKAQELISRTGKSHDFTLLEQYDKGREYLDLAKQFDGNNSVVKDLESSIDQKIASGMEKFGEKIDKQTWPKQASNAPSNAKKLTKDAKKWFENSPDWGSRSKNLYKVLAVVITGPWSIQKKNILDEPIMYGLPVAVAVQKGSDKKDNIARVFSLTLRTREMRGVKMEPPFDHATVGGSYYIRPNAL